MTWDRRSIAKILFSEITVFFRTIDTLADVNWQDFIRRSISTRVNWSRAKISKNE